MGHTLRMTFKRTPGAKELGINLLDANPTIWWNTLNNSSANGDELSVFDHFVRLAFKKVNFNISLKPNVPPRSRKFYLFSWPLPEK